MACPCAIFREANFVYLPLEFSVLKEPKWELNTLTSLYMRTQIQLTYYTAVVIQLKSQTHEQPFQKWPPGG